MLIRLVGFHARRLHDRRPARNFCFHKSAKFIRRAAHRFDHFSAEALAHVRALNGIAQDRGQSLAQMALAWTLRDPRVTSTLIGASSIRQLEENVGALAQQTFTDDELAAIDGHAVEAGINLWASSSAH